MALSRRCLTSATTMSRRPTIAFTTRAVVRTRLASTAATEITAAAAGQKKPRSRILHFCYKSFTYLGVFVAGSAIAVVAFFAYDASTYEEHNTSADIPVSELALNPRRGGPKNLPILEQFLDDDETEQQTCQKYKPKLVVLGVGWGNVALLKNLYAGEYHVTVVAPANHFLFTPLLPSATVGTLELRSLAEPVRAIIHKLGGHFLKARAEDIDFGTRLIECVSTTDSGEEMRYYVPYDKVVIGVGATTNPHGVKGLEHCHSLKELNDARKIKNAVISNLERASLPTTSDEERRRLLSFVVSGGGPTGVEFAAELFDMLNEDLCRFYPRLLRNEISVHVIQSRSHILNTYDEALSKFAENRFARDNVDVITNSRVKEVQADKILFTQKDDAGNVITKELPMGFCLWSTGVAQNPLVRTLSDRLGDDQKNKHALETDPHLRVAGTPMGDVYALGDASTIQNNVSDHIVTYLRSLAVEKGARDIKTLQISFSEWREVAAQVKKRFPQAAAQLKRLDRLFERHDKDRSGRLDFDELHELLRQIDSKLTSLPATAQRAHQQGLYLAGKLNKVARAREGFAANGVDYGDVDDAVAKAFQYHHMGSLAYVGNSAVFDFGDGLGFGGGLAAVYLWRGAYFAQSVSARTRVLLAMDWAKRALFGRGLFFLCLLCRCSFADSCVQTSCSTRLRGVHAYACTTPDETERIGRRNGVDTGRYRDSGTEHLGRISFPGHTDRPTDSPNSLQFKSTGNKAP